MNFRNLNLLFTPQFAIEGDEEHDFVNFEKGGGVIYFKSGINVTWDSPNQIVLKNISDIVDIQHAIYNNDNTKTIIKYYNNGIFKSIDIL